MIPQIAKVLIASQAQHLDKTFDYLVPESMIGQLTIGTRVIVPFQNRLCTAFVWELDIASEIPNLKSIHKIIDTQPLLNQKQIQLITWLANYYFCSLVDVIKLCLPPGAALNRITSYQLNCDFITLEQRLTQFFAASKINAVLLLLKTCIKNNWNRAKWENQFCGFPEIWNFLLKEKIVTTFDHFAKPRVASKINLLLSWNPDPAVLPDTPAAKKVYQTLRNYPQGLTSISLSKTASVSNAVIQRLIRQGMLKGHSLTAIRQPVGFDGPTGIDHPTLNSEQYAVYEKIIGAKSERLFMIHGITGSGKTELYFEVASRALEDGFQVLYLVPEIALAPQTLERARRRFGDQIALLHSNMSDGERYDQWFRIKNGQARMVIGARSALFAPFDNLALIIVDEEHETSYKQEETPRYHARTVAEKLAFLYDAKVIFGSATPAIESYYATKQGRYTGLTLLERFNQVPLPAITLVDMRTELQAGNRNILSRLLQSEIARNLANREQAILLLNRRGYSTFILCRDCGQALKCPNCDITLTYHRNDTSLRCHYCNLRRPVPELCPHCKGNRIRYFGEGTQKLEEELATFFPQIRLLRMDFDSTTKKGAHHSIYHQMRLGEADLLLGTQMVAKGLDLPNVTLVGVISADSILNIPDFRSAERTFQLLTQVAGRAGRGKKLGRVIFQAYHNEHYSLQYARNHDYLQFYETEIQCRATLKYPPFSELIKIGFSGQNEVKVREAAENFGELIAGSIKALNSQEVGFFEVLGPCPALVPRIQNKYRWQILIKADRSDWLDQFMKDVWLRFGRQKFADVQIIRDRNPYSVI